MAIFFAVSISIAPVRRLLSIGILVGLLVRCSLPLTDSQAGQEEKNQTYAHKNHHFFHTDTLVLAFARDMRFKGSGRSLKTPFRFDGFQNSQVAVTASFTDRSTEFFVFDTSDYT